MRIAAVLVLLSCSSACQLFTGVTPCARGEHCPTASHCDADRGVCVADAGEGEGEGGAGEGEGEGGAGEGEGATGEGEGAAGEGEGAAGEGEGAAGEGEGAAGEGEGAAGEGEGAGGEGEGEGGAACSPNGSACNDGDGDPCTTGFCTNGTCEPFKDPSAIDCVCPTVSCANTCATCCAQTCTGNCNCGAVGCDACQLTMQNGGNTASCTNAADCFLDGGGDTFACNGADFCFGFCEGGTCTENCDNTNCDAEVVSGATVEMHCNHASNCTLFLDAGASGDLFCDDGTCNETHLICQTGPCDFDCSGASGEQLCSLECAPQAVADGCGLVCTTSVQSRTDADGTKHLFCQ